MIRFPLCALLFAGVSVLSAELVDAIDPAWEQYGQRAEADFMGFMERAERSRHERDRTLSLLRTLDGAESTALHEIGRRWSISDPSEDSIRLAAIWTCPRETGSAQRLFCDQQQLLRRWQRVDSDNALLWTLLAARADASGDLAGYQSASKSLLRSDHFNTGYTDALRLLRERMAADHLYAKRPRGDRAMMAVGIALAIQQSFYLDLRELCPTGGPAGPVRTDRMDLCRHTSELMIDSGGILPAMLGNMVGQAYALDESERALLVEQEAHTRALMAAFRADKRLQAAPTNDGLPNDVDDYLQLVIEHGEREAMIRWLASAEPERSEPSPAR